MERRNPFKNLKKKRENYKLLFGILIVLSSLSLLFLVLLLTKVISFDSKSIISVFNMSEYPVNVNDINLEIYDTFVDEVNTPKTYFLNLSEEVQIEKSLPDIIQPKLSVYVSADKPYCFFSADVTSFYYQTEQVENQLQEVKILEEKGSYFVETNIDQKNNTYIFPGRYSSSSLPENLVDKKLIGIYPIDCEDITNPNKQEELVFFYKKFNSEEQRDFYNRETEVLKEELLSYPH